MPTVKKDAWTTKEMYAALRAHFAPPAWAFITEVGDATGFQTKRHADAVAMGVWPSRGMELYGIEVKVSRSDWLKELENPAKAEAICKYCDRWFLAVNNADIVKPGELPPTWGLIARKGNGLAVVTPAPQLTPQPITRPFLAALLRKSIEQTVDEAERKEIADREYQRGLAAGKKDSTWEAERDKKHLNDLREKVKAFEAASGIEIQYGWNKAERIGDAVKAILNGHHSAEVARRTLEGIERSAQHMREMIAALEGDGQLVSSACDDGEVEA